MALQILYFVPFNLLQPAASFAAVSGKLLVSPVLKKLVFLNARDEAHPRSPVPHSTHGLQIAITHAVPVIFSAIDIASVPAVFSVWH